MGSGANAPRGQVLSLARVCLVTIRRTVESWLEFPPVRGLDETLTVIKVSCCLVAAVAFGSLFAGSPTFAEQMDCSGTKKSKERPYTEVIRPGDRPDHEMRQAIRTHVISSKDAGVETASSMHEFISRLNA